ncbi:MAG: urocanate hydratase, partial [Bacteroidota bacterium]
MTMQEQVLQKTFQEEVLQGIPAQLPPKRPYPAGANRAPKRKDILSKQEKQLAIRNALRYFPKDWHQELATEFAQELENGGRIYMYRFKPSYDIYARPLSAYPAQSKQAAAIMLMIQNNLNPAVAQHPEELITYGGNGAVFQNWAQYLLTMQYLAKMSDEQTLHMYSGHPMGLFPSSKESPRVVVTNGMMIPNYSQPDDWEKYNALGVTQFGQMTAGSYMYIGPQGIVHGTTITVMNAFRKILPKGEDCRGKIFLTAGLGGMSGAQPKAGNISGCITICAEVNPKAARKRHEQGWVDVLIENIDDLIERTRQAQQDREVVSIAYIGNIVEVWERFEEENIFIHLGSDQTSLHIPWT